MCDKVNTVFRRTIFDYMKGMQFWILLALSLVLFAMNGILFCGRYAEWKARQEIASAAVPPDTRSQVLSVPPSPLQFMHEGDVSAIPTQYVLRSRGNITPVLDRSANIKLPPVPSLDWTFIIVVIFSLFAVLIGYDSISGEREDGTLKLSLSNSISRIRFCAAKYCAMLLVIAGALLAGTLDSIILIGSMHPDLLTGDTFLSAGAVIFAALLLCSFFALLSIVVSALIQSSPVVLLILLVAWVISAIIIPNTAPVIARTFSGTQSELQVARTIQNTRKEIFDSFWKKIEERAKNESYHSEEELKEEAFSQYDRNADDMIRLNKSYNSALRNQIRTARLLARISPTALFTFAAENLTRTGEWRDEVFRDRVENYSGEFDRYILKKFGVLRQSEGSFMGVIEFKGKKVEMRSPRPEAYKGDMSDFPPFQAPDFALSEGLFSALGDIAGLVIWNLLAAAGMFTAVQRMDVR
jgi:ABC-type transport system involved in multi-copper enzyme maturation permease subunit